MKNADFRVLGLQESDCNRYTGMSLHNIYIVQGMKKKHWHAAKADLLVIGIQDGALMYVVQIIEII